MARIRTIKPEFWTDATMVALPYEARLFFIGLWNFADDSGRFEDEPARLKLQVLPDDSVDAESLLTLLEAAGRIELCEDGEGGRFWRIAHFTDHQKIDHPGKSKFREPSRKRAIPLSARRELAKKYGCSPGGTKSIECFYCGLPGEAKWWLLKNGKPSSWVTFSLEIDHAEAEANGGPGTANNLVLACRSCNRSKGFADISDFLAKSREPARTLALEGKGEERKGEDRKVVEVEAPPPALKNVPLVLVAPEKPEESWDDSDFETWAQFRKQESGYLPEVRRGNLRARSAWWSACFMTPGVTIRALKSGFLKFGQDPYWEKADPPYPFAAFMDQWTKYVRPGVANARAS